MVEEGVAEIFAIEQATLSPWTPAMLCSELKITGGKQLVAVVPSDKIVGWCCCRLIPPEAELLKIAVDGAVRRSGIGCLLFNFLRVELMKNHISTLFLEVRSGNRSALKFYRKNNFFKIGQRPNYYSNPDDDALILQHKFIHEKNDSDLN